MNGSNLARETKALAAQARIRVRILAVMAALLWGLEIADVLFFNGRLNLYGIRPRSIDGLPGILFCPFLHAGFGHLLVNTVPLLVLGWFVLLDRIIDFFVVTLLVIIFGGVGIWLTGAPDSIHIGASGLVFGYLGFLLFRGVFQRSPGWIGVAVVVGFFYGGMIWGVLPSHPGISWQGHLFGFLAGIGAARLYRKKKTHPSGR